MPRVADVRTFLDAFAPPVTAADWDNVGLLLGDDQSPVKRIMTCLTVTSDSAGEAVDRKADLIVSHHPLLFRATKRITSADTEGRMLLSLLRSGVAVYSPHTAFDNCPGGINDTLADLLELKDVRPLRPFDVAECKIAVFVPESDLAKVSDAMFAAGAGVIGQYRECSFRTPGTGTFFGNDASNPAVGQKGRREDVAELRLEVVCPESKADAVVRSIRSAHSYEEPAFDVYNLRPRKHASGMGRIGRLAVPTTLAALSNIVREKLAASFVQLVDAGDRSIETLSIACGAAGEFARDAIRANADAFLTGEMRFHEALAAKAAGLAVLLPGHHATERPGVEALAVRLTKEFPELEVWASQTETDPLTLA